MSSQLHSKTRRDILHNTIRIAASIRRSVEGRLPSPIDPPRRRPAPTIPELTLPNPTEILAEIPVQLPKSVLQLLFSLVLQRQQAYIDAYKRACLASSRLVSSSEEELGAIYQLNRVLTEKHYLSMVKESLIFVSAEIARHHPTLGFEVTETRRSFNSEYTPLLEKYFEYNAYPSAQHQSILAEKSMMTRRQIEVWFQNHRNRIKKDDKILRRNTTDLPLRVALSVLENDIFLRTNRSPTPSDQESISEIMEEEDDVPQPVSCIDAFDKLRPQHAFPSSYPPSGSDPFLGDSDAIKFAPPTWARTPPSTSAYMEAKQPPIDMDSLARMFHLKLNIMEGNKKSAVSKISRTRAPWYAATVTTPPRAPHPAFIHAQSPSSSTIPSALCSPFSFQIPVGSRLTSTDKAFIFPLQGENRKISPLPRRVPTSFTTAASSPNRTIPQISSFSSEHSSRSRSSSSSSRSMTPEPTTPLQLPTLDFHGVQDANHVRQGPDDYDFSTLFGVDPNVFAPTSCGSTDILESEIFAADKQPSMPTFDLNSLMAFVAPSYIQARS